MESTRYIVHYRSQTTVCRLLLRSWITGRSSESDGVFSPIGSSSTEFKVRTSVKLLLEECGLQAGITGGNSSP